MSMGSKPTDPKITDDLDDVEAHALKVHGFTEESEPEGLAKVKRPQERAADEEDVEGHGARFNGVSPTDDDVEGHARRF